MPRISKQELIRLQKKFITDEKIGEQFGITRSAIFQLRRKYGIESKKNKHAERNEKIIVLRAKGQKIIDIAEKVGISPVRTYAIIRELNAARSTRIKKIKKAK